MKMTPRPRSRAWTMYFSTTPDCLTPSAAVGSSRISTLAPKCTAREIATHWRSPPDRVPMGWSTSRRSIPIASSSSLHIFFMAGMAIPAMKKMCKDELLAMGIDLRDVDQPIGTLSGGERQCVAISRAVHFGAKVLILDEPTAALGVKQSGVVLKYIVQARERGLGVIFITHNPHHAYPVGDRFLLLNRGASIGNYEKNQVTRDELTGLMAGGTELEQLSHELESAGGAVADLGRSMEADVEELGISHQPTSTTTTTTESDAR